MKSTWTIPEVDIIITETLSDREQVLYWRDKYELAMNTIQTLLEADMQEQLLKGDL